MALGEIDCQSYRNNNMSEICTNKKLPIQVTIWDLLGEEPVEMRKPLLTLAISAAGKPTSKKKRSA